MSDRRQNILDELECTADLWSNPPTSEGANHYREVTLRKIAVLICRVAILIIKAQRP
jgi:hypothetical protein